MNGDNANNDATNFEHAYNSREGYLKFPARLRTRVVIYNGQIMRKY